MKIQDIKKRRVPKSKHEDEGSWLDSFWHGHKAAPERRKKHRILLTGRKIIGFSALVAILMLATGRAYVVKADLSSTAVSAKIHLNNAIGLLSEGKYDQALGESILAKAEVEKIKLNLQSWGQNSQYLQMIDYRSDLVGAETLISAIDQVLSIASSTEKLVEDLSSQMGGQPIADAKNIDFKINIKKFDNHLQSISEQIGAINKSLEKRPASNTIISQDDQRRIGSAFGTLSKSIDGIRETVIPVLSWFCGEEKDKKIMLVFQNNAELRGSGGFIGSYAILSTSDSSIKKLDFQTNIYKLDNAAKDKVNVQAPPEYDILAGGKLYLRDANYAVDGPESFSEVMKMYKAESGQDLDGLLAIDTSMVVSLLKITGPIALPQYGMTVTSENFLTEVQTEVEKDYFNRAGGKVENEPKKILADMLPAMLNLLLNQVKNSDDRIKILEVMGDAIGAKHLLLYSDQSKIQAKIEQLNLGGKLATGEFDYFLSHSTNIGGRKSSLNISEDVTDNVEISSDGSVSHQVTIVRNHNGTGEWPDYQNINLMRVLLPPGSEVTKFEAIEGNFYPHMDKKSDTGADHYMGEEAGRTKLSFWLNVFPKESAKVGFSYKSAYKAKTDGDKNYRLYLQKQPGTNTSDYHINIKYPEDWIFVANFVHSDLHYDLKLDKDKIVELKFQ